MDIQAILKQAIAQACADLDLSVSDIILEHPADLSHGDYSTNIALASAKQLGRNPRVVAEMIVEKLEEQLPVAVEKVEIAGPGFINFYLNREFFTQSIFDIGKAGAGWGKNDHFVGKKVMIEYTQPNPFKPFHIGHLMSNAIGESLSRIIEASGATLVRANYQGDVGLHVAKALYGLLQKGKPATDMSVGAQAQYVGELYSWAAGLYESDESVKKEIDIINKKVYDRSDEKINELYDWGREVTLAAFEILYKTLGTKFDYYFFESEMAKIGEKIVRENIGPVFEESDGAIVFHAEKYDPKLHTRVFITSQGLPAYETKEVGLTITKFEKENPDLSIITTAIEQGEYMKVVQKAVSLMHPDYESRMKHVTHGMMRLASGKMSSRKGNVVTGESLISDSMDMVLEKVKDREFTEEQKAIVAQIVGVAALKYSILRSSLGSDIVYDFEKSISFEGDSGPYLQYTAVRANSILAKAEKVTAHDTVPEYVTEIERILYRFPEVVSYACAELEPHHIAVYLTELASAFNSFYANTRILDEENEHREYQIAIVTAFYTTMKNGLHLLGIETPEKM